MIEVFNPRVAFSAFNEEAARFAAKYRIAAGAGSDAHVAQGLGTARVRMRDFDGPRGVPRVDARRGDPHAAHELRLRAGAEVPADEGDARRAARRSREAATRPAGDAARPDAGRGRRAGTVESRCTRARHRRRDPREVPGARDPRAERADARAPGLPALPARQPDAGAGLRPSAGRRAAAQVRARRSPRSRRASRSTAAPAPR